MAFCWCCRTFVHCWFAFVFTWVGLIGGGGALRFFGVPLLSELSLETWSCWKLSQSKERRWVSSVSKVWTASSNKWEKPQQFMHFLLYQDLTSATNIKISNMHAPSVLPAAHALIARKYKTQDKTRLSWCRERGKWRMSAPV